MKKLSKNQRGVAHHFLLPLIVIVLIVGIGVWLLLKSHAEPLSSGGPATGDVGANVSTPVPLLINDYDNTLHTYRLFQVNTDGSGLTELKDSNGNVPGFSANWAASPSKYFSELVGTAYVNNNGTYASGLGIYNIASKTLSTYAVNGAANRYVNYPQFSPNGAHVAYNLQHASTGAVPIEDIYVANPNGTNVGLVKAGGDLTDVKWQPTIGNKLSYTAEVWTPAGGGYSITYSEHIINSDGNPTSDVNLGSSYWVHSAWSYDGTKYAYVGSDYKIHVVNSAGGAIATLAPTNYIYSGLSFDPSGAWILFYNETAQAIQKVNIASGAVNTILKTSCAQNMTWTKDGRVIYTDCTPASGQTIKSVSSGVVKNVFNPWGGLSKSPNFTYPIL